MAHLLPLISIKMQVLCLNIIAIILKKFKINVNWLIYLFGGFLNEIGKFLTENPLFDNRRTK